MAVCVRCGISGPLVRVDAAGLCPVCQKKDPYAPVPEPPSRPSIPLDAEEVFRRYLTTAHDTYPKQYRVRDYYEAEFDCMLSSLPRCPIPSRPRALEPTASAAYVCKSLKDVPFSECGNFVAFDTETSGLTARAEIVEITAVRFERFRPTEIFTTLCKPYGRISPEVSALTGIFEKDVRSAPRFAEIADGFEEFLGTLPLVAHNAPFDLRMLASEGCPLTGRRVFDTLPIARSLLRLPNGDRLPHYRLADCCISCAIVFSGAHRSTADSVATGLLFGELVKRQFGRVDLLRDGEDGEKLTIS